MSNHVFVDETKRRGYLLVASVVVPGDLDPIRRTLRGLVLPGQRRLHMKDESESRKRSIATAIAQHRASAPVEQLLLDKDLSRVVRKNLERDRVG